MLLAFVLSPVALVEAKGKDHGQDGTHKGRMKHKKYDFEEHLSQPDQEKLVGIKDVFHVSTVSVQKDIYSLRMEMKELIQSKSKKDGYTASDLENVYQRAIKMRQLREQLLRLRHKKHMDIVNLLSNYPQHQKKFLSSIIRYDHSNRRERHKDRSQASVAW